jgi:ABC-type sugar transport system permease subunit
MINYIIFIFIIICLVLLFIIYPLAKICYILLFDTNILEKKKQTNKEELELELENN